MKNKNLVRISLSFGYSTNLWRFCLLPESRSSDDGTDMRIANPFVVSSKYADEGFLLVLLIFNDERDGLVNVIL